ncbi:tripartite tricarboxylate transporter TctB family protein [Modestobacter sp. VKM Ac-2977]|uniref:tripartite tricarboxylate transporter TctB family protein n=1 Tax=Modestobacter sp. VKM Ac-2977 TaxID=3004131 RepID=UPI0022AB1096|nr:tripartite tricarboxylate transporter TctB family protein [Modestobacter sp. VKM Ac-2977]MCZ2820539.1 tripartite tricarboxylate transporter TctB family protein [Modestobacter sp. VKM Ac-2977]
MSSAHDGAHTPGSPGGRTAAGATPQGNVAPHPTDTAPATTDTPSTLHDLEDLTQEVEEEAEHRPPPAGPATNLVIAALVVALGAAAAVGALALGAGTARTPGPGIWPLILGVLLVVLGVGLAATARRTSDTEQFSRSSWLVLAGLATMLVFVALIGTIGFEIPAVLLAFVWLRFLGGESWRTSAIVSIAVVVAFYLVFVAALSVPVPHLF